MSRVANNFPTTRFNDPVGQPTTSFPSHSSSKTNSINGNKRGITVRSAAPPPVQKETIHACPLCNGEFKDPRVLPCAHTYCLNCIRKELIKNNQITCPKCLHQVQPFDETDLETLPRNIILSQEWRMNTKFIPQLPMPKKPVAYHPPTQMPHKQDNRKSSATESNNLDTSVNGSNSHGISALVNAFNKSAEDQTGSGARGSRSSSVASTQPIVSNLVKIYSEATAPKQPQQQKPRTDSIASTGRLDELAKIIQQASHRSEQKQPSSGSLIKQSPQPYEEAYEVITWDNLVHGATPVAPPFPDQWQTATENHHRPSQTPERPISVSSSDRHSNVDNLHDIITSIQQKSRDKTSPHFPPGSVQGPNSLSHPFAISHSPLYSDEDDDDRQQSVRQPVYTSVRPRQNNRRGSLADSIESGDSSSPSEHSPVLSIKNTHQQRSTFTPAQQQQDDKISHRTYSANSSSRRSSDRFPPPPQNLDTVDFDTDSTVKPRVASSMSNRSSANADTNQQITTNETNLLSTERFNPRIDNPSPIHTNNSSRAQSQIGSGPNTPTHRLISTSVERDAQYLVPTPSSTITTAVTSRVDYLLSDQKRLEREIEEQRKHLEHDYDDVRKQINRKESSIHNEVKAIATHLEQDITEHYHRKQKIYADLAADTNSVRTELERLKSHTNSSNNNNKQQLWANLEKIESNIRNIRQAVEQHREPQSALTFAEGRRAIAADTIGQITYNQNESHRRFNSPTPPPLPPAPPSFQQQTSTNITPYKYIKIDHLATLEPEAIAITENNKKIILGICNKLFILDEHGNTLRTIPLTPSIRGIAVSKRHQSQNIAYISHGETVSMIDIDSGQSIDSVKETDASGETGTFLPLGIDTDNLRGDVYVCDYRNSCVIKFDDKLEYITQWRIFNHSDQYDEARPKLISVYGERIYMIIEHSCKPYYNQGIAYTFSLHICDTNSGNIIKIIDADLLATQRLRWPCSVQAINNNKCYILDTMTSGKYFNGQWQKHWSRVLEIGQDDSNVVTELFQLDSEAATMAMTKQNMIIAANGDILFVDLTFLKQQQQPPQQQSYQNGYAHDYQNLS